MFIIQQVFAIKYFKYFKMSCDVTYFELSCRRVLVEKIKSKTCNWESGISVSKMANGMGSSE